MMKVCCDVELCLHELGYGSYKTMYEQSKFAIELHKSIQKHENADFRFSLSMFPNKVRCENEKIIFGERKMSILLREKIIR